MKILITGAGGFLGQYLARELADHNVYAFNRQQLDLANANAVQEHFMFAKYDAVIHCGAAGRNTPTVEDWNIVSNNLSSVLNLMTHRNKFGQLINIGTGAEFDVGQHIENVYETEIYNRSPQQSYGLSKNIIARYLNEQPDCFTLRLFGCFDNSEDDRRLLPKFHSVVASGNQFNVTDRPFDMISAQDFVTVIRAVLNKQVVHRNVNCVYAEKHNLSEILKVYCETHNLDSSLINVVGQGLSYTGNGSILDKYQLPLLGLEKSLSLY